MKFDLIKQKCISSSYKSNGERTECERVGYIFYVEGMPAFLFLENGDVEPITPDGCHIYINNKEECDNWLKTNLCDTTGKSIKNLDAFVKSGEDV